MCLPKRTEENSQHRRKKTEEILQKGSSVGPCTNEAKEKEKSGSLFSRFLKSSGRKSGKQKWLLTKIPWFLVIILSAKKVSEPKCHFAPQSGAVYSVLLSADLFKCELLAKERRRKAR